MEQIFAAVIVGMCALAAVYFEHYLKGKSDRTNNTSNQVNDKEDEDGVDIDDKEPLIVPPDSQEELVLRVEWLLISFGIPIGVGGMAFIRQSNNNYAHEMTLLAFLDGVVSQLFYLSLGAVIGLFVGILLARISRFLLTK